MSFFNKPYPYEDSIRKRLFISLAFGMFIALFLLIFQPFDLQGLEHPHKTLFILGYGLVTFISLFINMFIIPSIFRKHFFSENWTAGKEIIHISINILLITVINIFYSILFCERCYPFQDDLFTVLSFSFLSVMAIGLIPITIMVLVYQNILLKKNIKKAEEVNQYIHRNKKESDSITIYSNNNKNFIKLISSQLIAIEANGNYINVYYEEEVNVKKEMLRNTLKKIGDVINENINFVRCHKSYIVNLSKLKRVSGNAQGYKLIYNNLDFEIPVSRNLSKQILGKIKQISSSN